MKNRIDISVIKDAIDKRHHAMERFYDIEAAANDREQNLEMLDRLINGTASREDEEAALDLMNFKGF